MSQGLGKRIKRLKKEREAGSKITKKARGTGAMFMEKAREEEAKRVKIERGAGSLFKKDKDRKR
eukprot:1160264-Pelagomonas_calceolata.AAC.1